MKKPYKQNKLIKIKNINNAYKNRYKIRYSIFGLKFTIKNRNKIVFYKQNKENTQNTKYNELKKEIKEINTYTKNKNYILNVIVITYNHSKYIGRCLESILSNKTDYPYLITVIDDSSTDNTVDICLKYAKENLGKIQIIMQRKNTQGKHIAAAFKNIKTEYFAMIDGDDYWCCDEKIQRALDYLISHPDIIMYVHDVLYKYKNRSYSMMHDLRFLPRNFVNPFDINNIVDSHLSGRIFRNIIDFKTKYQKVRKRDGILNEIFLSQNYKAYFDDKIMSVYDKTTNGVWNSLTEEENKYSSIYRIYMAVKTVGNNKIFINHYRLNKLNNLQKVFGEALGWKLYITYMRLKMEYKSLKLIHEKYNKIEKGHNFYTKSELQYINGIERGNYEFV